MGQRATETIVVAASPETVYAVAADFANYPSWVADLKSVAILETDADFEALLTASHDTPVVIFKHSRNCGTSGYALEELTDHLAHAPEKVRYAMVTVQTHRALSDAIAARLGVRHHTPQALLVRNGQVVWSATHHRITADVLDQEVTRTLSGATAPHSN